MKNLLLRFDEWLYGRGLQKVYERKNPRVKDPSLPIKPYVPAISKEKFAEDRKKRPAPGMWCWLAGHTDHGCDVKDSYRSVSGKIYPKWMYYCARCNTADEYPDKRDIYFRFRVWLKIKYKIPFMTVH